MCSPCTIFYYIQDSTHVSAGGFAVSGLKWSRGGQKAVKKVVNLVQINHFLNPFWRALTPLRV